MSPNFFLNLANRSANKTTVPQARPYLHPVFMPPVLTLPVMGVAPVPPASQAPVSMTQERRSSHHLRIPEQPVVDSSLRSEPSQSMAIERPSPPMPQATTRSAEIEPLAVASARPTPTRLEEIERSTPAPVESAPNLRDGSARPRQESVFTLPPRQPASIFRSLQLRPDDSVGTATTIQPSPPVYPEPGLQKDDEPKIHPPSQPEVTRKDDVPQMIQPAMPAPFVPKIPYGALTTAVIERIITSEPSQPQQPQMPPAPVPEPQRPLLASALVPIAGETIRETLVSIYPDVSQTPSNRKPQRGNPTILQGVPPTTHIERYTTADAPVRTVQTESPAPIRIERVTPAPEQHPLLQPRNLQGNSAAPIQVSIGTIDLRINPPNIPKVQVPHRRKRPQGFDGFRQRRSYSGWED